MFRRARTTGITKQDRGQDITIVEAPVRSGLTPVSEWPESTSTAVVPASGSVAVPSPLFAGVCRYYHDCFASDSRGGMLTNVLDKNQAEYLTFAEVSDVLLTGQASQLEMPLSTAVTAQNAADVNRREKFLIYGSIFLVGRGQIQLPSARANCIARRCSTGPRTSNTKAHRRGCPWTWMSSVSTFRCSPR